MTGARDCLGRAHSGYVHGRTEMLENAELETPPAAATPSPRASAVPCEIGRLAAELRSAGVQPRLSRTAAGITAGGVALPVSVQSALLLPAEGERILRH